MKFSLYVNPQTSGPDNDLTVLNAATESILYADQNGFSTVYLTEHHLTGYNAFSDPLVYAAYLAPQVTNVSLSFSVAVLPLHHPLRFATQANLLDNLLKGRFAVGIGTGGGRLEYQGFGLPVEHRQEIMNEAMEAVLGCWQGDYEHHGRFFNFTTKGLRVVPAPYTKPHPKIVRAATSIPSVQDTGRRGWPVIFGRFPEERIKDYIQTYKAALEEGGNSPETIAECLDQITVLKVVYVGETDEKAREEVRPAIIRYLMQSALANSSDYIHEDQAGEQADAFIDRAVIVGSPETVAKRVQSYADVGVTNLMIWTYFGEMPPDQMMGTMRRFATEVMPLVNGAPQPATH